MPLIAQSFHLTISSSIARSQFLTSCTSQKQLHTHVHACDIVMHPIRGKRINKIQHSKKLFCIKIDPSAPSRGFKRDRILTLPSGRVGTTCSDLCGVNHIILESLVLFLFLWSFCWGC